MVKRYALESGSEVVRAFHAITVSCLVRIEIPAALWAKHRRGELDAREAEMLDAEFEADYVQATDATLQLTIIKVSDGLLALAGSYPQLHGLRAYDSLQLASATALRESSGENVRFVTADHALAAAAVDEGLDVLVPD